MHQAKILIEEIGREKVLCGLCSVLGVTSTPEGLLRFAGTYIVSVFNLLPRLKRFTSSEVVGKQEAGAATFVVACGNGSYDAGNKSRALHARGKSSTRKLWPPSPEQCPLYHILG